MALPAPHLDDRRFQQFVDDAKRYIQQRCPEWTDHNVSDPGVTLIEAVAHMADQIVYRLNRVPEKNHLAFLDLLGVTLFPPSAARADVTFWLSAPQAEPVVLPAGTEVATGRTETEEAVSFATEDDLTVVPCELAAVLRQESGTTPEDCGQDVFGGRDVAVFAAAPQPGDTLLFGLSAAVPRCAAVLRLDSRVDGVGVDPRQPPLRWEAWTADGWTECEVEEDSTGGLNRPGEVVLHVPAGHLVSRVGRADAAWLRCRVVEAAPGQPFYSASPTVRAASAFTIGGTTRVAHAEVVRDEPLGESTGVPGQRLRLAQAPVVADRPPLRLEISDGDGWQEWQVVADFASSGPYDRHITLEEATGEIAFGPSVRQPDGSVRQFGAVPVKGSVIRAPHYRTGGGRSGNVARGAIQVLRSSIPYVARVENREAARGGVDGETVQEAKVRAPIALRAQERAVTARDYEELARRAAPEAARIACLAVDPATRATGAEGTASGSGADAGPTGQNGPPGQAGQAGQTGENAVRVLVVPQAVPDRGGRLRFEQLVPGQELLGRVTQFLDERRPLGTRLAVGPPFYQGVTVVATLHSFRAARADRVRAEALDALYAYLDPLTGGAHGDGWPFGRPLRSGEIFAALQRVPGVELVDEVLLHPADPLTGRRGDATDRIELAPSALLFPFDHRVRVIEAR
ncbi:putative baseplate assembly protein [Streptomyces sp. 2224.1]|uniref:putative baseplate assembly protein n=1 Tax=unclassified Streptomyces TaxID=2593676 RepID=UPI000888678B|nr:MULTISPECIES: putative baseplate assembly protein [unclassified Streptomyces]PBC81202.1 putative phage baseplate assembly protein [Streptomyces sp. 2321.6]SDR56013.1 putative baseplate assembly protein [Streptomyces sp. KS_16]SEC05426.1 putative baseplate assembly protein [Streptomyces sp. 2133.1]SED23540.1 putative baseplate assembly protein [Streptomyces sp. 2224.1]SEF09642.1 putative baseplate assembly protein [Streptomyces sp. 2112.3]